jgi:RimJ/RimL family protein N-acetyltransferase
VVSTHNGPPGAATPAHRALVASDRRDGESRPNVLTTSRLVLREMTDADLDDVAMMLGDDQVMRYYPRPKTRDEAQQWIAWNRHLYRNNGFGLWIMTLQRGGQFIGECGLTVQVVDGIPEVEVGYHVLPVHQRRGYATEAAAACIDAAQHRFGIDRIIAVIHPDNEPSRLVAERIGLRLERHAEMYGQDRLTYGSAPALRHDSGR